jgi:hypothetical protein
VGRLIMVQESIRTEVLMAVNINITELRDMMPFSTVDVSLFQRNLLLPSSGCNGDGFLRVYTDEGSCMFLHNVGTYLSHKMAYYPTRPRLIVTVYFPALKTSSNFINISEVEGFQNYSLQ